MKKPPHSTHAFDYRGICLGCAMRKEWPGAADTCPVRHELSLTASELASRKRNVSESKKRYTEKLRAGLARMGSSRPGQEG